MSNKRGTKGPKSLKGLKGSGKNYHFCRFYTLLPLNCPMSLPHS